jgi:hypothetical protein
MNLMTTEKYNQTAKENLGVTVCSPTIWKIWNNEEIMSLLLPLLHTGRLTNKWLYLIVKI